MKKSSDIKTNPFKRDLYIYIFIIAFSFILYGNTIKNGYSLDDEYVTSDNQTIEKGISAIPEIFTDYYSKIGNQQFGYRPMAKATFAIEHSLFGENPHLSHFINIFFYILLCILIYSLLKKLLKNYNEYLSVFILFLFMAHPIHTEVVASLKNREELLCFTGAIAALIMFLKYSETKKPLYILWACLFYFVSLMSKTDSLPFLVIFPLTLYMFSETKTKELLIVFFSVIVICAIFYFIGKSVITNPAREKVFIENPFLENKSLINRFSMMLSSLLFYFKRLIYPDPLLFYYGYNTMPLLKISHPQIIISALLHLFLLVYSFFVFRKRKLLSYSILFYLISISIFSNFIRPVMGIVGERLAFISSFGFIAALSYLIFKIFKVPVTRLKNIQRHQKVKTFILLIIILIPLTARTINRNENWESHISLYEHDIKYLEKSAVANYLYAAELYKLSLSINSDGKKSDKEEHINKAIKYFNQCLNIYYENDNVHNYLGSIYLNQKNNLSLARKHLLKATELDTSHANAFYNLGELYRRSDRMDSALICYRKAVKIDSLYMDALSEMAKVTDRIGQFEEAVSISEKMIQIDSLSDIPYINLGNFYFLHGDTLKGIQYAEKAVSLNPENYILMEIIGKLYFTTGNAGKAKYYFDKAKRSKEAVNRSVNKTGK